MSTNDLGAEPETETESPDSATIEPFDAGLSFFEDVDRLDDPIAMGIEVAVIDGERRAGLCGIPNLGVATHYSDLLQVVSALDVRTEVGDARGEVGTLYYDTDADAVACTFDADQSA